MKITVYELLGLIKDDKAPKKIIYNNRVWEYETNIKDYYNEMWSLLENQFDVITKYFEDEVEIIEDKPKHIEELNISRLRQNEYCYPITVEIMAKINELTKAVNNLLDKEGK